MKTRRLLRRTDTRAGVPACFLRVPGAESASVGADVVEGGLSGIRLLFPLPFVDDEPPLEMGQELQVLLLLGHTNHLQSETTRVLLSRRFLVRSLRPPANRRVKRRQELWKNSDTFSFPGKRLSNFFCREKVNVSQPMLDACLPCQKYTTHWKSSSGCLSSSSSSAAPLPPPLLPSPSSPSFFSFSSSSYSTGTQYLRTHSHTVTSDSLAPQARSIPSTHKLSSPRYLQRKT